MSDSQAAVLGLGASLVVHVLGIDPLLGVVLFVGSGIAVLGLVYLLDRRPG